MPVHLLDVRTPGEFEAVHAQGALNLPMDTVDPQNLTYAKDAAIRVICQSGGRSRQVVQRLEAAGFTNVVDIDGGTQAWESGGLPVVEGRRTMSLERQVRIVAGALVLTGVLVGHFVTPWGYGLSTFVGGGLVFAGVTDTCGMGMLIARMPWNR